MDDGLIGAEEVGGGSEGWEEGEEGSEEGEKSELHLEDDLFEDGLGRGG